MRTLERRSSSWYEPVAALHDRQPSSGVRQGCVLAQSRLPDLFCVAIDRIPRHRNRGSKSKSGAVTSATWCILWNPDGRLSPREWELSWPIVEVAPEVAVDDEWAVPRGLLACPLLLRALYRCQQRNLTSVRPVRPTTVMGQAEWPTQSELEPHLLVAAWKPQKARYARNATPSSTNDLE